MEAKIKEAIIKAVTTKWSVLDIETLKKAGIIK